MAKAKKLPSGAWRCQVYSHTEKIWNEEKQEHVQKRVYESFTADTRREAERLAAEFAANKDITKRPEAITVKDAITRYIDLKKPVLSPSTVTGYLSLRDHAYDLLEGMSIRKIDTPTIQKWVSEYAKTHKPKTTANAYGLLLASLCMFNPDFKDQAQLPSKEKPALYTPTDEDVKKLLDHVKGKELEIAILLAAFGPMRRGEICALTSEDIKGDIVVVNKSYVKNENKEWEIKQPKTYSGYRTIKLPQFVIDRMSGIQGEIIKATPDQITNRFKRAIKYSGLPHFRFHDLRHYAASIMHALGMPDQYIMQRGGWSSDYVMKNIYRDTLTDLAISFNDSINDHFADMTRN